MRARDNPGPRAVRIPRPDREQLGGDGSGRRSFAGAPGPVEQLGMRRLPPGHQRGFEDGPCVRMALQLCQHPPIVVPGRVAIHAW